MFASLSVPLTADYLGGKVSMGVLIAISQQVNSTWSSAQQTCKATLTMFEPVARFGKGSNSRVGHSK